jgi:hypothetical protein
MSLISSSIPNFVNGVSQQPFTLRLSSQGELQENGLSTVSQGLKKRPPTQHLKKIQSTPLGNCFIHTINRDTTERYVTVITNGDLKVYDLAGNEKTVAFPNGKSYLTATTPSASFSAVTVADYTFVVNKTKVVTQSSSLSASRPNEALINVKAGNYGKTYEILLNGTVAAQFITPDGSVSSHVSQISTDYIAAQLGGSLATNGYNASGWGVSTSGSTIYIINTSADFTVGTRDGFNNGGMVGIKGRLQKFADLPSNPGIDGFVVEITGTGDANNKFDSYYVRFKTNTGSAGVGVWQECAAPSTSLGLTASTMPYTLVRQSDGTFIFAVASWTNRVAGDLVSNPNPSFVTRTISDIFFYRNRLGLLADEGVIFSEAGQYFNFFRTTVTDLLDADPIDVNASHTKVSILKHAVPFNKQLLLFSEQSQFIIDQNELLTPKTVGIKVATEFPCNVVAKPVGIGKNIYFAVDKGDWSAFREYFTDLNDAGNDSQDVTGHLPKYIPSGIFKISAAPNEDILVALTTSDASSIYAYKYFWSGSEKLQSSWSKFTLGSDATILNADFISSELFLIVNRSDGVYFEKMNVSLGDIGVGEPYLVHLDRKVQLASTALTYASGYTTINLTTLGYTPSTGNYQVVIKSHPSLKPGEIYNVVWDGTTAKVLGNLTGATVSFGRKFTFSYQLSTITVKAAQPGGGQKSDTEGRLQLRKISFNYADAGLFNVLVTPEGRSTYTYTYSGKILGSSSSTIGSYSIESGRFSVPIVSRNIGTSIVLQNDSALPCSFLSADWEGFFVKRSQAV